MNLLAGAAMFIDSTNEEEVSRSIQAYIIIAAAQLVDFMLRVA